MYCLCYTYCVLTLQTEHVKYYVFVVIYHVEMGQRWCEKRVLDDVQVWQTDSRWRPRAITCYILNVSLNVSLNVCFGRLYVFVVVYHVEMGQTWL